ncbi:unnamed protein product [Knipowitschia caucasica]|uniref:Photoreceptor cilium actin regulator n=1 Tax=Knipowitschia caucasica TaxID=637954 RepID=A0AAV2K5S1_KNICA
MGCSPSKGKLFSKPGNGSTLETAPLEEAPLDFVNAGPEERKSVEGSVSPPTDNEPAPNPDRHIIDTTNNDKGNEMETAPETSNEPQETDAVKGTQRKPKMKKKQRSNGQLRKSSPAKVDFPPHMVRAHQAAYAYLNPNISKFETLLELLDQAAHTQHSLQPMMAALVLRFEEINQALEEMAEEGELMLKEHGDYMSLSSGMMGPPVISPLKSGDDTGPSPDLLQQLLRHSLQKMRIVGGSFQTVGDSTLEDTVEYFASLSKVLVRKIMVKHDLEQRIATVLAKVEAAAVRKGNPEDSALHSEDSGIGGENDSVTGSDRQRRHRGSAGSSSNASSGNVCAVLPSNRTNEYNEEDEDLDEDLDEDDEDMPVRKRSNSSPPDPSQPLLNMLKMQKKAHRPQTALNGLAQSSDKRRPFTDHQSNLDIAGFRRHSVTGPGSNQRVCKTNPAFAFQRPKPPPSVKKLINNFSNLPANRRTSKSQTWTDSQEDPDEDNLPPPPPEVLMDNSFHIIESMAGNENLAQNSAKALNRRQGLSQRMKTTVELLPNRASIKTKGFDLANVGPQQERHQKEAGLDPDSSLYQQARAIIHIRSAAGPLQPPVRGDSLEGEAPFSPPVTAPPVSRVRLPPVGHRHPSPPARPQSSSSRPGSPRSIARATDNPVEQIVPSVSFKDARSVFCKNEPQRPSWTSCGASVLPKPWGESSRGRAASRSTDSPRRVQSDHRPPITIRNGGGRYDHSVPAAGH